MPLIRKVIPVGASKAVTIPKSWLDYIERETGRILTEVAVEVDGALTIKPFLEKNNKETKKCLDPAKTTA